jgi:hypothetical protein
MAGVLLLDNACNLLAGADDPAVAMRIVDDRGDDRRRGAGGFVAVDEPASARSVVIRACAVPSCGSCTTKVRPSYLASAEVSVSAWWPMTTVVVRGWIEAAQASTCSIRRCPATR